MLLGQMFDATDFAPGLNTEALCQSLVKNVRLKIRWYIRYLSVTVCLKNYLQCGVLFY